MAPPQAQGESKVKNFTIIWNLYDSVEAETEEDAWQYLLEALRLGDIYPTKDEVLIEEAK